MSNITCFDDVKSQFTLVLRGDIDSDGYMKPVSLNDAFYAKVYDIVYVVTNENESIVHYIGESVNSTKKRWATNVSYLRSLAEGRLKRPGDLNYAKRWRGLRGEPFKVFAKTAGQMTVYGLDQSTRVAEERSLVTLFSPALNMA